MSLEDPANRVFAFYRRHGLFASLRRCMESLREAVSNTDTVLMYCDLQTCHSTDSELPAGITIERRGCLADVPLADLQKVLNYWNRDIMAKQIREQFQQGASAWLVKKNGQLAGYGWTLRGSTMEPHFFPLCENDVHLFDFVVFPEFRGQGTNPVLVNRILKVTASEGCGRAFIEAARRNKRQMKSLGKTPFRTFGLAKKMSCFGWIWVAWHPIVPNLEQLEGLPR